MITMNILCIGDVTGSIGCKFLLNTLPSLKRSESIDLCIVNGENSADGNGITVQSADMIFAAGADVITGGNHTLRRREVFDRLNSDEFMLRPQNISSNAPGSGYCAVDLGRTRVAVINLIGRVYMNDAASPFTAADELLSKVEADGIKTVIVDFHAEATAEKKALGYYLDGRASAVFGTHTHVATSDCQLLPKGTGFMTDIGMTGPVDSVLGVKPELSLARIKDGAPVKFELSSGKCRLDGCVLNIDEKSGACKAIRSVHIEEL